MRGLVRAAAMSARHCSSEVSTDTWMSQMWLSGLPIATGTWTHAFGCWLAEEEEEVKEYGKRDNCFLKKKKLKGCSREKERGKKIMVV